MIKKVMRIKNIVNAKKIKEIVLQVIEQRSRRRAKELLALEVSEIEAIADKIFLRLDKKMDQLKSLEARADRKIDILDRMLMKTDDAEMPDNRRGEIRALAGKGLKVDEIAGILDIPTGEVELTLNLSR